MRTGSRTILCLLTLAVALTLPVGALHAAGVDWTTYGFDLAHSGYNPNETALGPQTVANLKLHWSKQLNGAILTQPLLASAVALEDGTTPDLLVVGDEAGSLWALDAATGATAWQVDYQPVVLPNCPDLPGGQFGLTGTPLLDRPSHTVYVAASDGYVHALDEASGAERTGRPVQITTIPAKEYVYGGLTLNNGSLYVTLASYCDFAPSFGRVVQIQTAPVGLANSWYSMGQGSHLSGGGIWGPAGVSIDSASGDVFAATGNAFKKPENGGDAEHVVRLTAALALEAANAPNLQSTRTDLDFGSTPLPFQAPGCPLQIAVMNKIGLLFIYPADAIEDGPSQALKLAGNAFDGIPAFDPVQNRLLIGNPSGHKPYEFGLVALAVNPDCSVGPNPIWQAKTGKDGHPSASPSLANGVVYFGDSGGLLHAYDAATGHEYWNSGKTITASIFTPPSIANGQVFAGAFDGSLYAFGL